MADLFKSDYASPSKTSTPSAPPTTIISGVTSVATPELSSVGLDLTISKIEPARYGLGKPVRVVIRGKITRD